MRCSKQRALSLIEVLLGLGLTTALLTGILCLYLHAQTHARWVSAMLDTQDQASNATALLSDAVAHAGLGGCQHPPWLTPLESRTDRHLTPVSDRLTVRSAAAAYAGVLAITERRCLRLDNNADFAPQQSVILSDCRHAQRLMIATVQQQSAAQTLCFTQDFLLPYSTEAQVSRYQQRVFFVRDTGRVNASGDKITGLYLQDNAAAAQEVVSGVSAFVIRYGVLDAGALHFYPANAISDWARVRLLRVGLLLTSEQRVLTRLPQQLCLFDVCWLDQDKRWRSLWYADMALRNTGV